MMANIHRPLIIAGLLVLLTYTGGVAQSTPGLPQDTAKPLQKNVTTATPSTNGTTGNLTTISPANTTIANVTTISPANTTIANVTTISPANTTIANVTTISPANTTIANVTTISPANTTIANVTTISPANTTIANVTTISPSNTTTANVTTISPSNTTASPLTTTPSPSRAPNKSNFSAGSFFGGIFLGVAVTVVILFAMRWYINKKKAHPYRTV